MLLRQRKEKRKEIEAGGCFWGSPEEDVRRRKNISQREQSLSGASPAGDIDAGQNADGGADQSRRQQQALV